MHDATHNFNGHRSYQLRLLETGQGTGYFSCTLEGALNFEEGLALARQTPNDEYLRRHLLHLMSAWSEQQFEANLPSAHKDMFLTALYAEAGMLFSHLSASRQRGEIRKTEPLSAFSPLIYLKSQAMNDREAHQQWARLFRENFTRHQLLPHPKQADLLFPALMSPQENLSQFEAISMEQVRNDFLPAARSDAEPRFEPEATACLALARLDQAGIDYDREMRHESSLSPIALLREWRVDLKVKNGRHDYTLKGKQTSYGRGLDLDRARAALSMEIVERCSSFASFSHEQALGYAHDFPLRRASFHELEQSGTAALNPNDLCLEAPYHDELLYWIEAEQCSRQGYRPIWIPAQCAFLFCNLDEPKLFSGLGSTGLASGNTQAEARLKAILEVVERDSEAVTPYHPSLCFEVETQAPKINKLLNAYRQCGIHVLFQDITPAWGVPCCQCFVVKPNGDVIKASGASLNAQQALISALTETPYSFPHGPPTMPGPENLLKVPLEKLPDYSTGTTADDLQLLETLLIRNHFAPIYVNLTRRDLGLPVVRAIIPGMEMIGEFGPFTRIHPRLMANYLKLYAAPASAPVCG